MPVLAGLLVNLFGGLIGWLGRWFGKRVAIGGAAVLTFSGLTVSLYVGVGLLLKSIVWIVPSESWILMGMWVALPDHTQALISVAIAGDTAIALYRWNRENLRLMAYIT